MVGLGVEGLRWVAGVVWLWRCVEPVAVGGLVVVRRGAHGLLRLCCMASATQVRMPA